MAGAPLVAQIACNVGDLGSIPWEDPQYSDLENSMDRGAWQTTVHVVAKSWAQLKLKLEYLATSCEELTHWKRPWCWVGLGAGGEGDDRGWDGWMTSPTQWSWVWMNSESWWWTGRPSVLRFMGSQSWTWLSDWTELNWSDFHAY